MPPGAGSKLAFLALFFGAATVAGNLAPHGKAPPGTERPKPRLDPLREFRIGPDRYGQYWSAIKIGSANLHCLVDSGASQSGVMRDTSRYLYLPTPLVWNMPKSTANGVVYDAATYQRVEFADYVFENERVDVSGGNNAQCLIGTSLLSRFNFHTDNGDLVLTLK